MSPSMRAPENRAAATRTRQYLSKAARLAVRRAAALADELNFYSFRVHDDGTISWTLRHQGIQAAREPQPKEGEATATQPSERKLRSNARAAAHNELMDRARAFRAKSIIRQWSQAATPLTPAQPSPPTLPPGLLRPPTPPPLPPPPLPQVDDVQPHTPKQAERSGASAKKHARAPPAAGDSPAGPRAKTHVVPLPRRARVLPTPPPSIPPSPPSTPISPPPPIRTGSDELVAVRTTPTVRNEQCSNPVGGLRPVNIIARELEVMLPDFFALARENIESVMSVLSPSLKEHMLSNEPWVCYLCGRHGPRKRFFYLEWQSDYPDRTYCEPCCART